MRKKFLAMLMMLAMSITLFACNRQDKVSTVSENGISGAAVVKHPFANDNYLYMNWMEGKFSDDTEVVEGIIQLSKTTGRRKTIRMDGDFLLAYVTDTDIYYRRAEQNENVALYRAPIVKGADGAEEPDFSKKEKILKEDKGIGDVYVNEDYILYASYEDYVVKYDRASGEKKKFNLESIAGCIIYTEGNTVILGSDNIDGYYYLDLEKNRMIHFAERIYSDSTQPHAAAGEYFYFETQEGICRYNMKNNKIDLYLSSGEIEAVCKEIAERDKKGRYEESYVTEIFSYGKKLYIQTQIDCRAGGKYHMNYAMLCVDLDGDKKVVYDEKHTKVMQGNSAERAGYDKDVFNSGRFLTIVEDKAILILNEKGKTKQQVAVYDMTTGELEKISKKDSSYYLPYSDSAEPFGCDDFEISKSYMRYMSDRYEE